MRAAACTSLMWTVAVGLIAAGPAVARMPACERPTPRHHVLVSSPRSTVWARGTYAIDPHLVGCVRGSKPVRLGYPADRNLVRVRGRWAAHTEAGVFGDRSSYGGDDEYFDISLVNLRRGTAHRFDLPNPRRYESQVRALALGGSGVFLYVQNLEGGERLFLRGRTRFRRLGTGLEGTFTYLKVRRHRASWWRDGEPHSVHFRIRPREAVG